MRWAQFFLFFALLVAAPAAFAQTDTSVKAPSLPALHRGLNLSSWLANAPRQPLYSRDFSMIKNAGFDHVRLPWNPEYVGFQLSPDGADPLRIDFIALDRAIALAEQYDLPVILDLHPSGEFVDTLENHKWAEKEVIALWQTLAERYKSHSSSALIFELLNEPQYYKAEARWSSLTSKLTAAIRQISPDRILIVGAPHGSEIDGLPYLKPTDDARTIYAFHFYEPYLVTHQGIHMGFEKFMIKAFRNMPYPSSQATSPASVYAPLASNPAEAQKELTAYIETPWNADHIASRINLAKEWAEQHHVRVICGEFGALRNHIDAASRYRWINDARTAMDSDKIGWEIWDYADIFGIATPVGSTSTDPVDGAVTLNDPDKGSRFFEPAALTALGTK
jgi:endoglucanase